MATTLSKDDYLFVKGDNIDSDHPHGDMDRLKTSFNPSDTARGLIMPLRSNKDIVSGEDICYLAEGAMERRVLRRPYPEPTSTDIAFSRAIKAGDGNYEYQEATPSWAAAILPRCTLDYNNKSGWVKRYPTDGAYDVDNDNAFGFYKSTDLISSASDFTPGHILVRANVEKLFTDEKKLGTFVQDATDYRDSGRMGGELSEKLVDESNYIDEYPYDPDTYNPELHWWGGFHNSPAGYPDHTHGGKYCSAYSYNVWYDLPDCVPTTLNIGQGEVWANFRMYYIILEERESGYYTPLKYITKIGNWTRTGNRLSIKFNNTSVRQMLISIARNKLGWDYNAALPDEYGEKCLYVIDKDYSVPKSEFWFTLPISHTKWWS